MDAGIVNGYAISPAGLGRAIEERGFDSLCCPEHTPCRSPLFGAVPTMLDRFVAAG